MYYNFFVSLTFINYTLSLVCPPQFEYKYDSQKKKNGTSVLAQIYVFFPCHLLIMSCHLIISRLGFDTQKIQLLKCMFMRQLESYSSFGCCPRFFISDRNRIRPITRKVNSQLLLNLFEWL